MATVIKKLINWNGTKEGVTCGNLYAITPNGFFIDDNGKKRSFVNGDWDEAGDFGDFLDFLLGCSSEEQPEEQPEVAKAGSALDHQEGGDHYKLPIQPIEYITKNGLGFCEGNVVKYITRWRSKNGLQDLLKVKHYVDLLIELEGLNKQQEAA